MLHLVYILAFTVIAFLAVRNLIHSLLTVGMESQKLPDSRNYGGSMNSGRMQKILHPELLDEAGNLINEPLLVMRSLSVQDARNQLDNLYKSSPGSIDDIRDED
ncbi:hypothetical protein PCC9214_01597 [Planktothrix tepida]|uniref:DUF2973 domain-containing protein n=2 Tax=Planktothrix TaxID=54304 RepID=A0A1J1LMK6_9CYAN|nr:MULTISPECIES: DUF2973 domain-containing protein [Planktothrix]CAD5935868.1 hypothetical protein PCC9214_01597 [Planktothrix tepida]CAD5975679.1 hypothetical protein NO713_04149 [Planktothrix pseudagardhii]CUR33438.1 conserved hypothetical protein [Planktothrix tepida PCC 9214]